MVKLKVNQVWKLEPTSWELRAKTKASLKPGLKMNVFRNTCDEELGGKMKSIQENHRSSFVTFQKSLHF